MTDIDVKAFIKKKPVLVVSAILAVCSFALQPTLDSFGNVNLKTLGILFIFMSAMAGLKVCGVFEAIAIKLTSHTKNVRALCFALVFMPYFTAMFITNDVALLVFVPLSMTILMSVNLERLIIPILILDTMAVNIGCMLTPFGNPHNLYVYTAYELSFQDVTFSVLPFMIAGTILILVALMFLKGEMEKAPEIGQRVDYSRVHLGASVAIFAMGILTVLGFIPYWATVAVAIVILLAVAPRDLLHINYGLILTFFFLFLLTGNISSWDALANALTDLMDGDAFVVTSLVSQVTSNVPSTILLDGFTTDWYGLMVGADVGGFGTPIASMAALITLETYSSWENSNTKKYIIRFEAVSFTMLLLLLGVHFLIG